MSDPRKTVNPAIALRSFAERIGEAPAVVAAAGRGRDGAAAYRMLRYRELDRESDRIAHGLERAGVRRGMRVVLMVTPGLEFLSLTFALLKLGAVFVLIDPGIGRKPLGICLDEAQPEAFIGVPAAQAGRVLLGWARSSVRVVVTVGRRWFWGGASLEALKQGAGGEEAYEIADTTAEDTAAIFFTSGSTGIPKGVVYTYGTFAAQLAFLQEHFAIEQGDVDLATFPPFALFGCALGMTVVIPDMDARRPAEADPERLLEAIRDHGAVQMFGSPALLDRLSRHCVDRGLVVPSLRRVVSAGAPVRPDILERTAASLAPDAAIHTPYGATEALPVTSIESREILGETRDRTARGGGTCVGLPVAGTRVRIIAIADGPIETWSDDLLVPGGEIGEIVVEGPVVTNEYYGREASTRLAKIRSGDGRRVMHRMGDLGWIDERGRLWFCGRVAHRVTTAEGTLFPIPCEGVANEHPDVFRSALVGVGVRGAQRPVLCLELEAGSLSSTEAVRSEVLTLCREHDHTRPIRDALVHPGFPVDRRHNAKIHRETLARWAERRLG